MIVPKKIQKKSKRITKTLILLSLALSLLVIVLFQRLVFRKVFAQYIGIVNRSFYYISNEIQNDWSHNREVFEQWFELPHVEDTFTKYFLNPQNEIDAEERNRDRRMIIDELGLQLKNSEESAFFLLAPHGEILFSSNVENSYPSHLDPPQRIQFLELQNRLMNSADLNLDYSSIQLEKSLGNGINILLTKSYLDSQGKNLLGVAVISIRNTQFHQIFEGLLDLSDLGEIYLVDRKGFFLTPPAKKVELYKSLGLVSQVMDRIIDYRLHRDIPVNNPGRSFSRRGSSLADYRNNPPTRIIRELEQHKDEALMIGEPYRNYMGELVLGFALWIEEVQISMVYEISLKQFLASWFWIQGFSIILIFSLVLIFLLVAVRIDKHRVDALDSNPLTHMPGNRSIEKALNHVIIGKMDMAVIYCDLDNFKAYNDVYGFGEGDRVIQFTADTIRNVMENHKLKYSFHGHIGGDDFIYILPYENCRKVGEEIALKFDRGIKAYYSQEDLERGGIETKDRSTNTCFFPIMGLSMAGVRSSKYHFTHTLELTNLCAEVKGMAKKEQGSVLIMDRRSQLND